MEEPLTMDSAIAMDTEIHTEVSEKYIKIKKTSKLEVSHIKW